jgi:hypothetical protein
VTAERDYTTARLADQKTTHDERVAELREELAGVRRQLEETHHASGTASEERQPGRPLVTLRPEPR